jgi:predicted dehydrogenase
MSIGVVGLDEGGWELARQFEELPQTELRWVCEPTAELRLCAKARFKDAKVTASFEDLLEDESLDAIVVATAPATHYSLALDAIRADKHVLVTPPLALVGEQADDLARRAEVRDRLLMVTEPTLFQPAIRKLKDLIRTAQLGEIYYVQASGIGVEGRWTASEGLWGDVGGGIAVLLHLLGDQPIEVAGRSESYFEAGSPDVVFCFLRFATGISGHIQLARFDVGNPRRLTVIGSERVAVYEHEQPTHKLTLYEKSVHAQGHELAGAGWSFRVGNVLRPELPLDDPVRAECEHFAAAARAGMLPVASGRESAAAVHVLSALERSLGADGQAESIARDGHGHDARVVELPLG